MKKPPQMSLYCNEQELDSQRILPKNAKYLKLFWWLPLIRKHIRWNMFFFLFICIHILSFVRISGRFRIMLLEFLKYRCYASHRSNFPVLFLRWFNYVPLWVGPGLRITRCGGNCRLKKRIQKAQNLPKARILYDDKLVIQQRTEEIDG